MVSLDEHAAARQRREQARAQVMHLGHRLMSVGNMLENPEDVRVNEPTTMRVQRHIPHILDQSEVPTWEQIAAVLRAFLRAEDEYLTIDSSLTAEQRRYVRHH